MNELDRPIIRFLTFGVGVLFGMLLIGLVTNVPAEAETRIEVVMPSGQEVAIVGDAAEELLLTAFPNVPDGQIDPMR